MDCNINDDMFIKQLLQSKFDNIPGLLAEENKKVANLEESIINHYINNKELFGY